MSCASTKCWISRRLVEAARAQEFAIGRIEREGAVATALQRARQAALGPDGRDAGDEIGEVTEGARRQAVSTLYSVYQVGRRRPRPRMNAAAVEGLEVIAVIGRHLDAATVLMSKLDSSSTMMMCGRLAGARQPAAAGAPRAPVTAGSESKDHASGAPTPRRHPTA